MALSSRRPPSLLRVPASPVPRSRRYYEGATTSHLRINGRLLVRCHSPRASPLFVLAAALLVTRSRVPGRGLCSAGTPSSGSSSRGRQWDLSGLQAIHPVPLLRSRTPVEPTYPRHLGHVSAAPAIRTAKASALADFGANPQLRHLLPYASRFALPFARKARFRLAGSAFAGRASNPLDRDERFQLVFTLILLSCSPDATG